jgi:hypothetical protein
LENRTEDLSLCHSTSGNVKAIIYISVILPLVLYGCETRSLILREEYRLRMFKNRVLRGVFGPERERK